MKALIAILIVVAIFFVGYRLFVYWEKVQNEEQAKKEQQTQALDGYNLPGVPYEMEAGLKEAYQQGPAALRRWLQGAKQSGRVKDPRLAWIELDYVVMVAKEDPLEAKRVFAEVKDRVSPDSPVYPRIQALSKLYE